MRNRVGPPVEGDDFFGRETELQFAWKLIEDGNSLILAAPRRVGKTSFAKKLIVKAEQKKWRTLELNLEGIQSEQKFVIKFIKALKSISWWKNLSQKIRSGLDKILENIELSLEQDGIKGSIAWKTKRKEVFEELENFFEHNKDTLIMIDELGVLLNTYQENDNNNDYSAEMLLNWFRGLRQISNTKIRWIFCSSVGIRNYTNRHEISYTINDLEPFKLKIFDENTARQMIEKLSKSKNITIPENIASKMLKKLEWYLPYFIQLMFKQINYLHEVENLPIDESIVDKAFDSLAKNSHLDTWDERLKYYFEHENNARSILTYLSKNENGLKREKLFDIIHNPKKDDTVETEKILARILVMLENDGYLFQNDEEEFNFRSPLLKKYWFFRFVK